MVHRSVLNGHVDLYFRQYRSVNISYLAWGTSHYKTNRTSATARPIGLRGWVHRTKQLLHQSNTSLMKGFFLPKLQSRSISAPSRSSRSRHHPSPRSESQTHVSSVKSMWWEAAIDLRWLSVSSFVNAHEELYSPSFSRDDLFLSRVVVSISRHRRLVPWSHHHQWSTIWKKALLKTGAIADARLPDSVLMCWRICQRIRWGKIELEVCSMGAISRFVGLKNV